MALDPADTRPIAGAPDSESLYAAIGTLLPGMLLCALIAGVALLLHHLSGLSALSPMIVAIALGALVHNTVGTPATITKFTRVIMLAPMMMVLGALATRCSDGGERGSRAPLPYFALGFVAAIAANSTIDIAPQPKDLIVGATTFLLALSLAAMGLSTDVKSSPPRAPVHSCSARSPRSSSPC